MQHFFKKSLGQHFLINKSILKKIVSLEDIKGKVVFEIGPGQGALTKEVLQKNNQIYCLPFQIYLNFLHEVWKKK